MNRFSFGSLRVRLIFLVLVAIIPSLIIIIHVGWEERKISAHNATQDAMQLAIIASGDHDLLIESTRQLLAGLARLPELRQEDPKACSDLLADLLKQYQQYNNIIAVKPNGDLWCSGIPASGSPNYADRGWFPEVMRTRDFVVGEYVIGRVTKKPQSSIAYPIIDAAGKVQKIIVTGFGLDWLNQFVAKTKLPPGSVLTVIDRNFTVLARTLEPGKWVGQTVKQAPIVNAIRTQQNQGTLETTGIDGIQRLYAFAPLGTQTRGSVYVFVGIPASVAYAQANWMLTRNLTTLGLAALLAFIVAWVGGNLFLLRRINALLHTAKRLENGDLSARTGIMYGPGELSKLARAFDQMAESLEQRIAERQRMEEEKRRSQKTAERLAEETAVIADIGRLMGSTLDIDEVYERFAAEARKLIAFDRLVVNLNKPQKGTLACAYAYGLDVTGRKPGDTFSLAGSVNEVMIRTREGLIIQPTSLVEIVDRYPSLVSTFQAGMHSMMSVPLIARDDVIGGLHFRAVKPNSYTVTTLRLAERIGMQIAGAIANAQMFNDLSNIEKSLRESNELFSLFMRHSPIYTYIKEVTPTQSLILQASDNYLQRTGILGSQMAGKTMTELFPPEFAVKITTDDWAVVSRGDVLRLDEEFNGRSYTTIKFPIIRGDKTLLAGYTIDITDRKRTEAALRESEERWKFALEGAGDGLWDWNAVTSRVYFSKQWKAMLGYADYEVGDTLDEWDIRVHPEDKAAVYADLERHFRRETETYQNEHRVLCKDGSYKWILDRGKVIEWTEDGRPRRVIGSHTDITERKRAEEENRALAERLHQAEKMEALGQLAGGVAHDLNNVLGVLSGYSELLLMEIPEGSRSRGHAEKILQSTEKGAAIIQDLLTLARRGVTASDVINLNGIVSDFLKTPVFEKMKDYNPRVTFRTECDKELLNIKGSPVHLEKTLINLVSNAAESISGKGEVTIRTESRYLDKPLRGYDEVKEGDYAVLTVSDTGMGIPAENREKIFEPFYTKKTMGRSGTGLGLAIVWGTVKDHNGYVDAVLPGDPGGVGRTTAKGADRTIHGERRIRFGGG
jgi:PAS domain S-box-containing protein